GGDQKLQRNTKAVENKDDDVNSGGGGEAKQLRLDTQYEKLELELQETAQQGRGQMMGTHEAAK
ncbi:hypothetical protein Pmani_037753, partial [Petrolisthes manimaculis]